jgi:hypothetical protein
LAAAIRPYRENEDIQQAVWFFVIRSGGSGTFLVDYYSADSPRRGEFFAL